jgi:magnesium-transporting ATPase (P-type)
MYKDEVAGLLRIVLILAGVIGAIAGLAIFLKSGSQAGIALMLASLALLVGAILIGIVAFVSMIGGIGVMVYAYVADVFMGYLIGGAMFAGGLFFIWLFD